MSVNTLEHTGFQDLVESKPSGDEVPVRPVESSTVDDSGRSAESSQFFVRQEQSPSNTDSTENALHEKIPMVNLGGKRGAQKLPYEHTHDGEYWAMLFGLYS